MPEPEAQGLRSSFGALVMLLMTRLQCPPLVALQNCCWPATAYPGLSHSKEAACGTLVPARLLYTTSNMAKPQMPYDTECKTKLSQTCKVVWKMRIPAWPSLRARGGGAAEEREEEERWTTRRETHGGVRIGLLRLVVGRG